MVHETKHSAITLPGSPFGIVWGFTYGLEEARAEVFMPQLRQIGAGSTRIFLFWHQIEPEAGHFVWDTIDTFLDQLASPDEAVITLCSSSCWATRHSTEILPPSPAHDLKAYYRFVYTVVTHCKGRVRYWQCDNEPSSPIFWSGTVQEYVAQLKAFYQAVKEADADALVILGGYDGVFNPYHKEPAHWEKGGLEFFAYVLREAADHFDVFDLHLYSDPYTIPARIDYIRQWMSRLGYQKPIIIGEYNGPDFFFEFPEHMHYIRLMGEWMQMATHTSTKDQEADYEAGKNSIAALYESMNELAPQTQMFMVGCSPELEQKRHRINARELVMRNLLAFSAGAQKTQYWNLYHGIGEQYDIMHILYAKHGLMDYEDGMLKKYYPASQAFSRMVQALEGIELVRQIQLPEQPAIYLFEVLRSERSSLFVVWERRDIFNGEDEAPTRFEWACSVAQAQAIDALGQPVAVELHNGRICLDVSLTPIFVEVNNVITE